MRLSISFMMILALSLAAHSGYIAQEPVLMAPMPVVDNSYKIENTPVLKETVKQPILAFRLPSYLSERQKRNLKDAYDVAKHDGIADPKLLQGIIMTESRAGVTANIVSDDGKYLGIGQVSLVAAQTVLQKFPHLWERFGFSSKADDELKAKLIENDRFNLAVASKYLLILRGYGYRTNAELALAYQKGPVGATRHDVATAPYPQAVLGHIDRFSLKQQS